MAPLLPYVLILLKLVADSTFSEEEVQKAIPEGSSLVKLLALGLWVSLPVKQEYLALGDSMNSGSEGSFWDPRNL